MKSIKQSGFTIIELVVTITVGSILMLVVTQSVTALSITNKRARDLGVANTVIEERIETLRSQGYTSLNNGSYDFSADLPPELLDPNTASYTISTFTPSIKKIDATISFNDASGGQRTYNYAALIGELGVGQ